MIFGATTICIEHTKHNRGLRMPLLKQQKIVTGKVKELFRNLRDL